MVPAWGKADRETDARHHLAHHCADVAATFIALVELPTFRARAERAASRVLSAQEIECLGALAFLHDIGKIAPAFQVKARNQPFPLTPRGHVQCGWKWLSDNRPDEALAGHARLIANWPGIEDWVKVIFAHHGRPVPCPNESWGQDVFGPLPGYDWKVEENVMGEALISWFPAIGHHQPPAPTSALAHFVAGLLALADWVGSDREAFPFIEEYDPGYWDKALGGARKRLCEIGLDISDLRLAGPVNWSLLSDHPSPRPAQKAVSGISLSERLVILEAETGSGKTEAALWRFAQLHEAREVDALYFAVPTRTAARQLQRRINDAMKRMFSASPPEAVLAIPGQALSGEARGVRLPEFRVLWDDVEDGDRRPIRWAAEHATRFLAAPIAVGTVDQVMMAGLQAKHAHLRGSALSRSLLVIDEVHASDAWMTEIQHTILRDHLAIGGHAFLMSATLGAVARSVWLSSPLPSLPEAEAEAYPVVWTPDTKVPVVREAGRRKEVTVNAHPGWSAQDAAGLALDAARAGARVLVIRNTVDRARETWTACMTEAPGLMFKVDDVATLHHGRFAVEDRARLDARVEALFSAGSAAGSVVLCGTQTLEQSLDIDADFLVTDLCPMDVLLQRIGRLHRHARSRVRGFERAECVVLRPEGGLSALTQEPKNGLGAYGKASSLSGVYLDVSGLQATLEEVEEHALWHVPEMNRGLVERTTHPDRLDEIAREHGWEDYSVRVSAKTIVETRGAELVALKRDEPFPDIFPHDEAIRTRLGATGIVLDFPEGTTGPFGTLVTSVALPTHWSRGLKDDDTMELIGTDPLTFRVGRTCFLYNAAGLQRMDSGST